MIQAEEEEQEAESTAMNLVQASKNEEQYKKGKILEIRMKLSMKGFLQSCPTRSQDMVSLG